MPNIVAKHLNEAKLEIEMEADLSAAAAVSDTRGTDVECEKTNTGEYTFTIKGTGAIKLYEVLYRDARLHGTPATAFDARIVSVDQDSDTEDITVVVNTLTNAATPAAANVTGACVLSVKLVVRTNRMDNPL